MVSDLSSFPPSIGLHVNCQWMLKHFENIDDELENRALSISFTRFEVILRASRVAVAAELSQYWLSRLFVTSDSREVTCWSVPRTLTTANIAELTHPLEAVNQYNYALNLWHFNMTHGSWESLEGDYSSQCVQTIWLHQQPMWENL